MIKEKIYLYNTRFVIGYDPENFEKRIEAKLDTFNENEELIDIKLSGNGEQYSALIISKVIEEPDLEEPTDNRTKFYQA